ncbi:TetR/AcrR family transcriptional regulator [Actinocorallia herbida]|nr:TetR/AcrR family transcriptional regulator [Actinocorallia herbida]
MHQAVLDVIAEHGLGAVTMAECTRRAGVTGAAPYRHFNGLDDLLLSTAHSSYENWNARRGQRSIDLDRPQDALNDLIVDFFDFARDEPGAFLLIFDSGLQRHSALIDRWSREGYDQFVQIISAISGAPVEECHIPALGVIAVVFGHAKMALAGFSRVSVEKAAELSIAAIELLLDGFGRRYR